MAKAQKMSDKKNFQDRKRKTFKGDIESNKNVQFSDKSKYLNFKYDEKLGMISAKGKEYIIEYEKEKL
jgi:hypothetical protein